MTPSADSPTPAGTSQDAGAGSAGANAANAQRPPRLALLIATGFGLGYLPKAPGTWGSLLGVLAVFSISAYVRSPSYDPVFHLEVMAFWFYSESGLAVLIAILGIWSARRAAGYLRTKDPQIVVVDEISGQQVALLIGPNWFNWQYLLAGFILFRVFDIWKPWPVRAAEKLPGGWGIMADDWVAGIYAALCLWGLRAAGL